MMTEEKYLTIWRLMSELYPQFHLVQKPSSRNEFDEHFDDFFDEWEQKTSDLDQDEDREEIEAYHSARTLHQTLLKATDIGFQNRCDEIIAKLVKNHRLNQSDCLATEPVFSQWLGYEYLEIREAVALAIDRDPEMIDELIANNDLGTASIRAEFHETYRALGRQGFVVNNSNRVTPKEFVSWLKQTKSNKAEIAAKILSSVKQSPEGRPSFATTKEIRTLEEILIGLAIDKFHYKLDGQRNPVSKNISDAVLRKTGIYNDPQTVKKYLDRAKIHCGEEIKKHIAKEI